MFLKHNKSGDLVEVKSLDALIDPCKADITGCFHAGEEVQDSSTFTKNDLSFPSGENLPQCWLDPDYKSK